MLGIPPSLNGFPQFKGVLIRDSGTGVLENNDNNENRWNPGDTEMGTPDQKSEINPEEDGGNMTQLQIIPVSQDDSKPDQARLPVNPNIVDKNPFEIKRT